jgi:nucleoside-diphosphate-sugar epimerase
MMHILITGAAGMIGRKLSARLVKDDQLNGKKIDRLTLIDVVAPEKPAGFIGTTDLSASDLSSPGAAAKAIAGRPDVIFHLAGVVSGEAETDFDKGYRVNLDGTRALLEEIRAAGYKPKVVFTSSIAVYGAPFPASIGDEFQLTPLTSYGTQKAISELLLADYNRRGILDGVGIRLPTICVRPGKPNKAASGFFSGIIREPLAGQEALLPVAESVRHTHASPRAAVGFLIHAAGLTREQLGPRINLAMPGVSCTVGEQIDALRRVAGDKVAARIRRAPDELVQRIVSGWAERLDAKRARDLGFKAETSFDDIVRAHIEDELGGKIAN